MNELFSHPFVTEYLSVHLEQGYSYTPRWGEATQWRYRATAGGTLMSISRDTRTVSRTGIFKYRHWKAEAWGSHLPVCYFDPRSYNPLLSSHTHWKKEMLSISFFKVSQGLDNVSMGRLNASPHHLPLPTAAQRVKKKKAHHTQ